jgi:hypothetical protein
VGACSARHTNSQQEHAYMCHHVHSVTNGQVQWSSLPFDCRTCQAPVPNSSWLVSSAATRPMMFCIRRLGSGAPGIVTPYLRARAVVESVNSGMRHPQPVAHLVQQVVVLAREAAGQQITKLRWKARQSAGAGHFITGLQLSSEHLSETDYDQITASCTLMLGDGCSLQRLNAAEHRSCR